MLNPFGLVQTGAMIRLADVTATLLVITRGGRGPDGKGFPLAINLHSTLLGNQR